MSPLISTTDTTPNDWQYVSEGGATIVFSYTGFNPHFTGTVLRLRKTKTSDADANWQHDCATEFQTTIMERLISPQFLPRLTPVRVERAWLEDLTDLRDSDRPHDRRQKDRIDVSRKIAVLATDLIGTDGLAAEIKPKWAFLPSPTHLSLETRPIKTKTCRFCMHKHWRSWNGSSVSLSYCPLDLFSGDDKRIHQALCDLWDDWIGSNGSVNNLRLFLHGKMIQPTHPLSTNLPALREMFLSVVHPRLMCTPVLRTLAKLQRSLDALDIEGLSKLWALSYLRSPSEIPCAHVPPVGSTCSEPSMSDWTNFIDQYLSIHRTLDHANPRVSDLRYYLLAYLLSATFKDCSIMLRVNPTDDSRAVREGNANSITIIDLGPKSIDRLSRWEALDAEIVGSYTGIKAKHCADGWKDA